MIEKRKIGVLCRDVAARLTMKSAIFQARLTNRQKKEVVTTFGLIPFGVEIHGLDAVFQTFIKGFDSIGIEWDVWSGFIVVAKNKGAESLVREIGH